MGISYKNRKMRVSKNTYKESRWIIKKKWKIRKISITLVNIKSSKPKNCGFSKNRVKLKTWKVGEYRKPEKTEKPEKPEKPGS